MVLGIKSYFFVLVLFSGVSWLSRTSTSLLELVSLEGVTNSFSVYGPVSLNVVISLSLS